MRADLARRRRPSRTAALLVLLSVSGAPASAAADRSEPGRWAPREWAFGAGVFDLAESDRAELDAEVRFRRFELGFRWLGEKVVLEPAVGALVNEDDGFYGYGSLRFPFHRGERWRLTPYTGLGIYSAGDGKDLGGPVEFRSGLEVAARVGRSWWFGVNYFHLSNAVLYDRNPGAESLVLTFSFRP